MLDGARLKKFNSMLVQVDIPKVVLEVYLLDLLVDSLYVLVPVDKFRPWHPLSQVWSILRDVQGAEFRWEDDGAEGHIAWFVVLVLHTVLLDCLLQLLHLRHNLIWVLSLPNIVDSCYHNNFKAVGQVKKVGF